METQPNISEWEDRIARLTGATLQELIHQLGSLAAEVGDAILSLRAIVADAKEVVNAVPRDVVERPTVPGDLVDLSGASAFHALINHAG